MIPVDTKTCASRSILRELTDLLREDRLTAPFLLRHYRRRELRWKLPTDQALDADGIIMKSLHSILQVGVYFTCGAELAVFKRPDKERNERRKVTDGFSVLKSWSPTSLHPDELARGLAKKVSLAAGPRLDWQARGIAHTDIFERTAAFAPHYLFLLYEIPLADRARLSSKAHLAEHKETELFADWLKPGEYAAHHFPREFFDPYARRHVPFSIKGAVDRLLLTSLQRGHGEILEDTTRGYAGLFPAARLRVDGEELDFPSAGIEPDAHMYDLLRVIESVHKARGGRDGVSLQDVLMLEPNFAGMGIRVPEFVRWLRDRFDRHTP